MKESVRSSALNWTGCIPGKHPPAPVPVLHFFGARQDENVMFNNDLNPFVCTIVRAVQELPARCVKDRTLAETKDRYGRAGYERPG
jgi:hypothetical protein